MAPVVPRPESIHAFADRHAFEQWLAAHHDTEAEIWIRIHKKASGLPSITPAEALDVVLCWGWIDGIRKALDETSFLQRYSPRGKTSIWSVINQGHVSRLLDAGRMQAPGLREIDRAKADGRWDRAYHGSKSMEFPPDLEAAIRAEPEAQAVFDTLNSQNRYALAFRTVNMKTEAGRKKKIAALVDMLKRGETIYPNGKKPKP